MTCQAFNMTVITACKFGRVKCYVAWCSWARLQYLLYCHIPEPAQRKYFWLMLGKFEAEKLPSFNEGGSEGGRQSVQYFRPSQQIWTTSKSEFVTLGLKSANQRRSISVYLILFGIIDICTSPWLFPRHLVIKTTRRKMKIEDKVYNWENRWKTPWSIIYE